MRALDLYGLAREAAGRQTRRRRAALEAYSDGVNAWMRVVQQRGARARRAGVLPLHPGDRPLAAGRLDRGAEADGAADDRQGGAGDAARQPVAAAAARAAERHPAAVAQRAADGAAASSPSSSPSCRRAPLVEAARHPLDPLPRAAARRRLERLRRHRRARRRRASRCSRPTRTWRSARPSIWMLARLDLASGPVIGGTIPGIPAVLVGRSDDARLGPDLELSRRPGRLHRAARTPTIPAAT